MPGCRLDIMAFWHVLYCLFPAFQSVGCYPKVFFQNVGRLGNNTRADIRVSIDPDHTIYLCKNSRSVNGFTHIKRGQILPRLRQRIHPRRCCLSASSPVPPVTSAGALQGISFVAPPKSFTTPSHRLLNITKKSNV